MNTLQDAIVIIICIVLLTFGITCQYYNMGVEKYIKAEDACISLGSHVLEFDRNGEAICKNKATINYKEFFENNG